MFVKKTAAPIAEAASAKALLADTRRQGLYPDAVSLCPLTLTANSLDRTLPGEWVCSPAEQHPQCRKQEGPLRLEQPLAQPIPYVVSSG